MHISVWMPKSRDVVYFCFSMYFETHIRYLIKKFIFWNYSKTNFPIAYRLYILHFYYISKYIEIIKKCLNNFASKCTLVWVLSLRRISRPIEYLIRKHIFFRFTQKQILLLNVDYVLKCIRKIFKIFYFRKYIW